MSYAPRVPLQIDWASPAANNAVLYYKYDIKGATKEGFQEVRTGPAMRTHFHESFLLESFVQSNQQKLKYDADKVATDFSSGTIQKVILYSQEGYAKRKELEEKEGLKLDSEDAYCQELKNRFPRQCPKQNYEFQGVYHPPDPTEANTPTMLTVTVTGGKAMPPAPAPAAPAPAPAPKPAASASSAAQVLANPATATTQPPQSTNSTTTTETKSCCVIL